MTSAQVFVEPFGDAACRVRLPAGHNARALLAALRSVEGVVDAVVTERHALVTFDPAAFDFARVAARIEAAIDAAPASSPAAAEHVVRVRYDGADLGELAAARFIAERDVVRLHTARSYVVAAIGFLPGFAYLRELDPTLVVPRRAIPRHRVPPGSVAVAGPYTAVYPFATPGGWTLVGTALDVAPFDPVRGARVALGDRVSFVEAP